ncbi:hypothetical protein Taro_029441 [Colocasia esculenta]|uniref:Uncharacterized protein n=1 Tax=Colocasia esculenta TaxID=4460 RepID=A0A843VX68_COLES|nr:hypothetical protein [Colocasia esculenta]
MLSMLPSPNGLVVPHFGVISGRDGSGTPPPPQLKTRPIAAATVSRPGWASRQDRNSPLHPDPDRETGFGLSRFRFSFTVPVAPVLVP